MVEVKLYTKKYCPFCIAAKRLLDEKKMKYELIEDNEEANEKISKEIDYYQVPKIFINDKFIGGYSDLKNLDETKELDKLLGK